MRNLKLSFALVIAVLAVGFTVATKAGTVRSITDCFTQINLADASTGTNVLVDGELQTSVQSQILATPYVTAVSGIKLTSQCPDEDAFCCATIQQVFDDPAAPTVTIEGVTGKFKILRVYYRNL